MILCVLYECKGYRLVIWLVVCDIFLGSLFYLFLCFKDWNFDGLWM